MKQDLYLSFLVCFDDSDLNSNPVWFDSRYPVCGAVSDLRLTAGLMMASCWCWWRLGWRVSSFEPVCGSVPSVRFWFAVEVRLVNLSSGWCDDEYVWNFGVCVVNVFLYCAWVVESLCCELVDWVVGLFGSDVVWSLVDEGRLKLCVDLRRTMNSWCWLPCLFED